MEFWKINGNGNDFVTFNAFLEPKSDDEWSLMTRRLCRRHASIGADGLLAVEPSSVADFKMRLFNADGSEGEMCGNGARCIARFAYENGIASAEMSFETLAGIMHAKVKGSFVEIDLGTQTFEDGWKERVLTLDGYSFRTSFLWVGVPHLALFVNDELKRDEMFRIGRAFRNLTDLFPQGTNVNFVLPVARGEISVVTYERGVEDLTESCGTGGVASALSTSLLFDMDSPIDVHNPGGTNRVTFERLDEFKFHSTLGGKTAVVIKGEVGPDA